MGENSLFGSSAASAKKKKKKKASVEFHKGPFLSSLFLRSFNTSPSFQVGEEKRKVDNVCWHADHAEIPQNEGENACKIEWASHRHPGGEDQKHCSFSGERQSCNKGKYNNQSVETYYIAYLKETQYAHVQVHNFTLSDY